MKLITAIVNKDDAYSVQTALTGAGFQITRLATTGGFLQAGNVTFMAAVSDERLDEATGLIKEHSHQRKQLIPSTTTYASGITNSYPVEVTVGGAVVVVQDIEQFMKF